LLACEDVTSHQMSAAVRRAGPGLGLAVLTASLVVGADLFGTREALLGSAAPPPRAAASSRDPFSRVDTSRPPVKTVLRSYPWWQEVARLQGAKGTPTFEISDDASQWRVSWECRRGRFVVRSAAAAKPLIDAPCAGRRTTEITKNPDGALQIAANGPWRARVEQQVDVPLVEPPLPAMSAQGTRKVANASFYRIDQVGRGRATIYRLPSGRYALRLRDFYVTPNVDLELRLSSLRAPKTTRQYLRAPSKRVAPLDISAGSMNFVLPAGIDPGRYRSIVVWCPLITSAYAAATLKQGQ